MFDRRSQVIHTFNTEELNEFLGDDLPTIKKQLLITYIICKLESKDTTVSLTMDDLEYTLTDVIE